MTTRRTVLAGMLAAATAGAAGGSAISALAFPLPENLTPEFLRTLAASTRSRNPASAEIIKHYGHAAPAYFRERFALDAEIWDRMADQREPFDRLEAEMFERDRALIARYGIVL
ncbi:hypothetical protein [Aurantimonas sp. Leaf443]|uniref:hypothetical protein n=1 Tax=Aurantimonas sp. Leaf443 TaxID=1736378 RepID=UPI0006F6E77A|nr:hypothetical protein [Aurantimonas sp. Leaf443]KQT85587.1 hypothetical protein ASG48_10295 [Aurantimonas sp. Leaf443]